MIRIGSRLLSSSRAPSSPVDPLQTHRLATGSGIRPAGSRSRLRSRLRRGLAVRRGLADTAAAGTSLGSDSIRDPGEEGSRLDRHSFAVGRRSLVPAGPLPGTGCSSLSRERVLAGEMRRRRGGSRKPEEEASQCCTYLPLSAIRALAIEL